MRYGSVCSGIEAATVAWEPLGWEPAFFSEIEAFPRAVLQHHYPAVPLHGDFTTIEPGQYAAIDLLVGGTPCQDFSVAGLRAGLDGERGNLSLEFLRLADRLRPRWVVWENVPGVLSSDEGRAFGAIVGGMVQLGYGIAWRVLDAQYFGVPQRRRRVFIVGCLGNANAAAAVLFERHSLSGHPAPRREARQVAPTIPSRSSAGGGLGTDFDCDGGLIALALTRNAGSSASDPDRVNYIAHALRAEGFDASEDGTGRGTPIVPDVAPCLTTNYGKQPDSSDTSAGPMLVAFAQNTRDEVRLINGDGAIAGALAAETGMKQQTYLAFTCKDDGGDVSEEVTPTLRAMHNTDSSANGGGQVAIAFSAGNSEDAYGIGASEEHTPPLRAGASGTNQVPTMSKGSAVRRLTPRECERLQGFPDDWTLVPYRNKPAADGPRYRALGNSMAVPCMWWIGERIAMVEEIIAKERAA